MCASKPLLTEPFEASLVDTVQFSDAAIPKRISLSDMLPPLEPLPCVMLTPELRSTAEPCCSAGSATAIPIANIVNIAPRSMMPWRRAPTILPNMNTCAAGISRIASTSRKFESPVGFSNGTAEFEL